MSPPSSALPFAERLHHRDAGDRRLAMAEASDEAPGCKGEAGLLEGLPIWR